MQDVAALAICVAAIAWLLHRLVLRYLPDQQRPDVTTRALVKRTRERRDCH